MNAQADVTAFLYEVYGYQKIEELLASKKPESVSLKDFLTGTWIHTFRPRAVGRGLETELFVRVTAPRIARVYTTQEFRDRNYQREPQAKHFSYHLADVTLFNKLSLENVEEQILPDVFRCFPEAQANVLPGKTKKSMWQIKLLAPTASVFIQGSSAHNSKYLEISFDASPELVKAINGAVARYYGWLSDEDKNQVIVRDQCI